MVQGTTKLYKETVCSEDYALPPNETPHKTNNIQELHTCEFYRNFYIILKSTKTNLRKVSQLFHIITIIF